MIKKYRPADICKHCHHELSLSQCVGWVCPYCGGDSGTKAHKVYYRTVAKPTWFWLLIQWLAARIGWQWQQEQEGG